MDVIPSYFEKLRSVAITLDSETVRLQQALKGEESDFEDNAVKIVRDLHSEVQTLKDDVNIVLQKVSLENQDNIDFIKATKVLMKRNSVNIMKIREFFQKYGYNPRDKENSVDEHDIINSKPQLAECDDLQKLNTKDDLSDLPVANSFVAEVLPRSPQLADFGLERYMISQTLPNHPQEVANSKEEPTIFCQPTKQSPATILKTPKCALKMDDFECITPKLEHFSISEYTYLNEDYTMGLKNVESNKSHASEDATGTEPVTNDSIFASPGLKIQRLKKKDAEYTNSPLAPTFCTPGLEIPSTKSSTALEPTDYLLSKRRNPTNNWEGKDCGSLYLNSRECRENLADPSSPTISSYENLLRTPTPPEVTPIPEDILQILSKYSSNLATPIAVKALPPRKVFPAKREGQNIQDICN